MINIAIAGYYNSGKTTLFSSLTGNPPKSYKDIISAIGMFKDEKLVNVANSINCKKISYPEFTVIDTKGPLKESGFKKEDMERIKDADIICLVIDNFSPGKKPLEDLSSLNLEFIFHDTEKIEILTADRQKGKNASDSDVVKKALLEAGKILESGKPLRCLEEQYKDCIKEFGFISNKKILCVFNGDGNIVSEDTASISQNAHQINQQDFYKKILTELSLILFYTVKNEYVSGWIIPNNTNPDKAAGKIHKDFEKGFIRVNILSYDNFLKSGSWQKAKQNQLIKTVGKEGKISDGDIVEFLFNI